MINREIIKISYRNLWRRRARTIVVICMISIGLAGLIFSSGLYDGMAYQMIKDTINSQSGHISIFAKGYRASTKLVDAIKEPLKVEQILSKDARIKTYYKRLVLEGMISSARISQAVKIIGIEEGEKDFTNIKKSIIDGDYASLYEKRSIIIGSELIKKLRIGLGKKVVLMGQTLDKSINSGSYRIKAIVQTNNPDIDRYSALLPLDEVQKLFQAGDRISSYSIILNNEADLPMVKDGLKAQLGDNYEIYTWMELYPMLETMQGSLKTYNIITFFIVFLVVAIGIFDIFLISILERVKEFGIMLAIGTKFSQLAQIIIVESLTLGFIGLVFGSLSGLLILAITNFTGINFGLFAAGMEFSGIAAIVHPQIAIMYFIWAAIAVFITSFIAVLWPIRILSKLKPVQAIKFN